MAEPLSGSGIPPFRHKDGVAMGDKKEKPAKPGAKTIKK